MQDFEEADEEADEDTDEDDYEESEEEDDGDLIDFEEEQRKLEQFIDDDSNNSNNDANIIDLELDDYIEGCIISSEEGKSIIKSKIND